MGLIKKIAEQKNGSTIAWLSKGYILRKFLTTKGPIIQSKVQHVNYIILWELGF